MLHCLFFDSELVWIHSYATCSFLFGNLLHGRSPCVDLLFKEAIAESASRGTCLHKPQTCKEGSGYREGVVEKKDMGSCKVRSPFPQPTICCQAHCMVNQSSPIGTDFFQQLCPLAYRLDCYGMLACSPPTSLFVRHKWLLSWQLSKPLSILRVVLLLR